MKLMELKIPVTKAKIVKEDLSSQGENDFRVYDFYRLGRWAKSEIMSAENAVSVLRSVVETKIFKVDADRLMDFFKDAELDLSTNNNDIKEVFYE